MNGKLYVIGAPADIFSGLTAELQMRMEYINSFMGFPKGRLKQITRSLLVGRVPLPKQILYFWFEKKELDHLLQATSNDRVLLYECANPQVLRAIKALLPKETICYIYYCNPISTLFNRPEKTLKQIANLGFHLTTFDPSDAQKFGLKTTGQYFRYPKEVPQTLQTDCFFCGLPKDRERELNVLRSLLEGYGYSCNFIIPTQAYQKITYQTYLKQLGESRCVVDICQKNQTGLTRRPLEALFYEKKLITNNPMIKKYDFYNPKNIFIFGEDSPEILKEFIRQPVETVPEEVKAKYDINGWVSQYLTHEL